MLSEDRLATIAEGASHETDLLLGMIRELQGIVTFLWDRLDDIDTADDIANTNDQVYRSLARRAQNRRWETGIRTDGYDLDFTNAKVPENKHDPQGPDRFNQR